MFISHLWRVFWHPKSSHLAKTESLPIFVEQKLSTGPMYIDRKVKYDENRWKKAKTKTDKIKRDGK